MYKTNQSINNILTFLQQVNAIPSLFSQTRYNSLVNTVIFVVDIRQFDNGNSCLVFVLLELFEEFLKSIAQEKKLIFIGHAL